MRLLSGHRSTGALNVLLVLSAGFLVELPWTETAASFVSNVESTETPAEGLVHEGSPAAPDNAHRVGASPQVADEEVFILQEDHNNAHFKHKDHSALRRAVGTIVHAAMAAVTFALLGLIGWEVSNFVFSAPDPFEHVEDPAHIPQAIEDLLSHGKPLAFVIRRCKYCGLGIRAMRRQGKEPVVIMVEGNRHREAISRHLRSRYGVKGYPYFFLDRERHGYLSTIVSYAHSDEGYEMVLPWA